MRPLVKAFAIIPAATASMLVAWPVSAQQDQKQLSQAGKQGFAHRTIVPVKGNVTAQAMLIPSWVASHIFGGEITNKSSDAALIIQGINIDYSDWALSGSTGSNRPCKESRRPRNRPLISQRAGNGVYRWWPENGPRSRSHNNVVLYAGEGRTIIHSRQGSQEASNG